MSIIHYYQLLLNIIDCYKRSAFWVLWLYCFGKISRGYYDGCLFVRFWAWHIRIYWTEGKAKILLHRSNSTLAFKIYFTYGSYNVTLTGLIKVLYIGMETGLKHGQRDGYDITLCTRNTKLMQNDLNPYGTENNLQASLQTRSFHVKSLVWYVSLHNEIRKNVFM